MYDKLHSLTIREKLIAAMLFLAVLSTIYMGISSYWLAMERVKNISMQLSEQYTNATGKTLSNYADGLHELSNQFIQSEALEMFLEASSKQEITNAQKALNSLINEQTHRSKGEQKGATETIAFDFINIYLTKGASYESNSQGTVSFKNYQTCLEYFEQSGTESFDGYNAPEWILYQNEGSQTPYLVYMRFLYEPITFKKQGVVLFGIEERYFSRLYLDFTSYGFILREDGMILSSATGYEKEDYEQIIEKILHSQSGKTTGITYIDRDGKERIVSVYQMIGMKSYLVVPFEFYDVIKRQEIKTFVIKMLQMGLIDLIVVVGLSILISRKMTGSITSLVSFVKRIDGNSIEQRYDVQDSDEVGILGEKINDMLDKILEANQQKEQEMREKQSMEIELLQQEINPHLLYNTLDSLLCVMEEDRTEDAIALTYALADFFKISLSKGSK